MKTLKILVIDDDEDYRFLIKDLLKAAELPVELEEASSSKQGIAILKDKNFDCVLIDYIIPGVSGLDVIKSLKSAGNETPFIVLTAFGDDVLGSELIKQGAYDFIGKESLNRETLKQKVLGAVARSPNRGV
jgi:DNA-binding NtrC family response regulator